MKRTSILTLAILATFALASPIQAADLPATSSESYDLETASSDADVEDYQLLQSQKDYVLKWYPLVIEESVDHNMPWQIPMVQGILESASGTTRLALEHHNHHGITKKSGGYQHFGTDEEGWRGYFDNIEITAVYSQNGIYETFDDPEACIDALVNAGYAEDTEYRQKLLRLLIGVEKFRVEAGLLTSAEYADKVEEEAQAAWMEQEIEQTYFDAMCNSIKKGRTGVIARIGGYMAIYDYLNKPPLMRGFKFG